MSQLRHVVICPILLGSLLALSACGGTAITHRPPYDSTAAADRDVIRIRFSDSASDVTCHHAEKNGELIATPMTRVRGDDGVEYIATVPGATDGRVRYFFTFVNSNHDKKRVPEEGFYQSPAFGR